MSQLVGVSVCWHVALAAIDVKKLFGYLLPDADSVPQTPERGELMTRSHRLFDFRNITLACLVPALWSYFLCLFWLSLVPMYIYVASGISQCDLMCCVQLCAAFWYAL